MIFSLNWASGVEGDSRMEVNTIEDLILLLNKVGHDLIISKDLKIDSTKKDSYSIYVYDDYVE